MAELTVVIPVWDAYTEYLPTCLASVRAQGVDARIVIVDNASTTPLEATPDCHLIRLDRRLTAGAARNAALPTIYTPYVAFVDVDDQVLPDTYRFCISQLDQHPDDVACATRIEVLDERSGEQYPYPERSWIPRLSGHRRSFALYMLARCGLQIATGTVLRTAAVRDCGGFSDSNNAEDWALAAKLAWRGPVRFHAREGRIYRVHDGSLFNGDIDRSAHADGMRGVRDALATDPAVPKPVKWALPLLARFHEFKADRAVTAAHQHLGAERGA